MKPGSHQSEETKAKISALAMGRIFSPETRARISAAHLGLKASPETRARMSATKWKYGRQTSCRKDKAKRRTYGFVPLNEPFVGCEGHHINDRDVIYIPRELHHSIYHRQSDGRGMDAINALAYEWLAREAQNADSSQSCSN